MGVGHHVREATMTAPRQSAIEREVRHCGFAMERVAPEDDTYGEGYYVCHTCGEHLPIPDQPARGEQE